MLTQTFSQAGALGLLAAALLAWPRSAAGIRLERAIGTSMGAEGAAEDGPGRLPADGRALPEWARSRWLGPSLAGAAVVAVAQIWSWSVAVVAIAVIVTGGRALLRRGNERAVVRAEQAAVEGLGVLVAELRAGRSGGEALAAAGRHCGHPLVGAELSRLGRSVRLGDRLEGSVDSDRAVPATPEAASSAAPAPVRKRRRGGSSGRGRTSGAEWQARLVDGLRLSQVSGCALADVVAAVESDLGSRGHQRADLRAAAAGHSATVALLAGLPILGLAMGSGIGADPVEVLTSTSIGNILLLTGVGLELLGLAWSRGITGRVIRDG
ncbi:MAG: hypothetical protein M3313_13155 [Actinomycetota bacterium]|nr:hypothetical protein [Actinomycetota bacterium]